jgi:hypothetical protein
MYCKTEFSTNNISLLDKSFYISESCPLNKSDILSGKIVKQGIDNYFGFLEIFQKALLSFVMNELRDFDPLVGENACQLRGYIFATIANDHKLKTEAFKYIEQINEILNKIEFLKIDTGKNNAIGHILSENKLDIKLPLVYQFIALSYFLTITKTSLITPAKDQESSQVFLLIKEDTKKNKFSVINPRVSSNFSEKLDLFARKRISELSIQYIQEQLSFSPISDKEKLLEWTTESFLKKTLIGLNTIPALYSTEIILKLTWLKKTPIILKIRRINSIDAKEIDICTLLYMPDLNSFKYNLKIPTAEKDDIQNCSAIICEAVSIAEPLCNVNEFLQEISKKDFVTMVLSFMAAHPQYCADLKNFSWPENDKYLNNFKQIAIEEGFCKQNPKLCHIYHIYADFDKNHLKRNFKPPKRQQEFTLNGLYYLYPIVIK